MPDEGNGVGHDLAPLALLLLPDDLSGLLTVLQTVIAPEMLDVVQFANLGEHAQVGL